MTSRYQQVCGQCRMKMPRSGRRSAGYRGFQAVQPEHGVSGFMKGSTCFRFLKMPPPVSPQEVPETGTMTDSGLSIFTGCF
ncbi:MAG TPA: hypothetical protein DCQ37_15220, partial [Desulfobacteraceae bacterium]|nr:hypothetical protein [Desulfobacteraceae bacterium]